MEYSHKIELVKAYEIRNVILTESNIEVTNKNTVCPICGGGLKTGCFSVSKNKFKCFSCGEGGTSIDFIMKTTNLDFNESVNYLANKYLNIINDFKPVKSIKHKPIKQAAKVEKQAETINDKEVNNTFIAIVKSLQTFDCKEYEYLKSRGFNAEICKKYGLNWFTIDNYRTISSQLEKKFSIEKLVKAGVYSAKNKLRFFKHRILISYKHNKDVQHLQARSLPAETDSIKYLFSGGKRTVFNAHNLKGISKETKYIYLCEGAFDAVSVELLKQKENEIIKAVALGSVNGDSKIIDSIIELCTKKNKTPVFAFDNDKAGEQAKDKVSKSILAEKIRAAGLLITTETPTAKDFNIDLQNAINDPKKQINENIYNIDTDVYISCLEWLKTLKNYTSYSFDLKHKQSLSFLSEFDNCNFRFIAGNKIITLKIN